MNPVKDNPSVLREDVHSNCLKDQSVVNFLHTKSNLCVDLFGSCVVIWAFLHIFV